MAANDSLIEEFPDVETPISSGIEEFPDTSNIGAVRQALGRFAQAAAGGVAGTLEAIPIAATALSKRFGDPLLSEAEERDVTSRPIYRAGRAIRSAAEEAFPIDPDRPKSFWGDTIPQAAGSMAAFVAGGAAGKLAKASAAATVAVLGAGVSGADAFDEAKKSGASDEDAFKVFAINAGLGTTEAVPIAGWLNRLDKASGNRLKRAIVEGSEEAVQEIFQTVGSNLTAQKYYDPNRKIFEGAGEGGVAGFTLGGVASLVVSAIGGRRAGVGQPQIQTATDDRGLAVFAQPLTEETQDAIPQQISATLPLDETSANRPPLVEEIRQPKAPAQEVRQGAPTQTAPMIPEPVMQPSAMLDKLARSAGGTIDEGKLFALSADYTYEGLAKDLGLDIRAAKLLADAGIVDRTAEGNYRLNHSLFSNEIESLRNRGFIRQTVQSPPIEPEVARQKLWENMQGREMDIPRDLWEQPASPHLKMVLGANTPSWKDLNFSGVVTANRNPDGSYRVKLITRAAQTGLPENIGGAIGGESRNLSADTQAIEAANKAKQIKIFAEMSGVPYVEGDTGATVLAKIKAKAAPVVEQSVPPSPANALKETGPSSGAVVTTPTTRPVMPGQAKEPWQMSLDEYRQYWRDMNGKQGQEWQIEEGRRAFVESALARKLPVPAEVLADFPDIKPETKSALPAESPMPATPVAETSGKPIGSFVADTKDSTDTWIKETVPVLSIGVPIKLSRPSSDGGWQVSFEAPSTLGKTGRQMRTRNFFKKADALTWIEEVKRGKSTPAPASDVAPKQPRQPTVLRQIDDLIEQHGIPLGLTQDLDLLQALRITEKANLGSAGLAAIRRQNAQRIQARERLAADLKIEKDKINTAEGRAELLTKLKERIASNERLVEVALADMPEGAEFTIHGEKFTVKDTNADTGIVTLKDGRTLKVDERSAVKIDPGSLKAAAVSTEFVPPETNPGRELAFDVPLTLRGEKAIFVAPTKQTTAFGSETLSQNDLFQIEQVTKEVDPFKSADVAQQLYGGPAAAATVVERQLRTLDQNPEFKNQFDKKQRARLSEVLNLLRQRATEQPKSSIISKLESLKLDQGKDWRLYSLPHPDAVLAIGKSVWNGALDIAIAGIKAGKAIGVAIDEAIAYIRSKVAQFDEAQTRENLDVALTEADIEQPPATPETSPIGDNGVVTNPATGASMPAAEGSGDVVNIAGHEFIIVGKERLTPEQKAAADARVRDYFGKELGLPGAPDLTKGTLRGATDTNVVYKIVPDNANHDDVGERLLAHLIEQIQMQHQPGGDPAYVSSLVNAINKNFDAGNISSIFSDSLVDRLISVSVGESSWRGTMLRAITGITEDMVTVARNAKFFLRRTYENMFGGDLVRKVMDRLASNFRETVMSGDEIERLYNSNPKLQGLFLNVVNRLRVKPSLREVIQEIFNTRIDKQDDIVEKFVDTMVNRFSATPEEAAKLKIEFASTFAKSFQAAREKAQAKALSSLTPEERKVIGAQTPLWKKLTDLVNSGWFDSAKVVEEYAKSKGWLVPTEKELEKMRQWSIKEQSLREPTAADIANSGGDVAKATERVVGATLEARQELLRKMNTQWSRWTHPVMRGIKDITDPLKRYNTAMAANEWLTANLLLKLGFGARQIIDVGTQMVLHTPTRAAQYAFEQWSNDRSAGRDSSLLNNLSQAMTDAYRTRLKVLGDTLASFRRTLAGKGEQKNVEQLLSSIAVFDRALLRAEEMRAEGKPAAARLLTVLALTMRFGRQFAAAADVIQGVPAEAQEIAHQIRTGLREQGKGRLQQELEFNTILGLLTTARVESLAEARQILDARGLDTSNASVQRAAWHILREKIYNMAKQAGLPGDEWKAQNHHFRNVIGWNEPESQGFGGIGGPGGLVAMTAKAGKEVFSRAGIPAFPFVFGNAMGISLNRKLSYSPLGLFPGLFTGSPWFEGERNIRQRKIEAVIGTTTGSILFTLAALGIWTVLPRKWPEDEKERAQWTANGWAPGMLIIPISDTLEQKISTRVGPMSLLSPYLAAGGAFRDALVEQAKKQAAINERAAKLGLQPEQLEGLDASQWLSVIGSAAWASAAGGRTASGMLGSYTDFGKFSPKKTGASATSTIVPGLPGYQEISRMAGANINPKMASFWDLLVPLPTSDANRVNLLGDPMRNENDAERIFQVLSGGTSPLPSDRDQFNKNKAYTNLFASDFRPSSINPSKGYQFGNELRPMTEAELQRYTVARGKNFAEELDSVNVNAMSPDAAKSVVQAAFQRANVKALTEVGATPVVLSRSGGASATFSPASADATGAPRRTSGLSRIAVGRRSYGPSLSRSLGRPRFNTVRGLGRRRSIVGRVGRVRRLRARRTIGRRRRLVKV